jgi:hypothetical protein
VFNYSIEQTRLRLLTVRGKGVEKINPIATNNGHKFNDTEISYNRKEKEHR